MNPTNGKGDKNLHKRQQCSDEQMLSNWDRAFGNKAKKDKAEEERKQEIRDHHLEEASVGNL